MLNTKFRKKILLLQVPPPYFTFNTRFLNSPLAAGYLKAMANREGLLKLIDIEILDYINNELLGDARLINAIKFKDPGLIRFSLYPSNIKRSSYIIEQIKLKNDNIKIIVGVLR